MHSLPDSCHTAQAPPPAARSPRRVAGTASITARMMAYLTSRVFSEQASLSRSMHCSTLNSGSASDSRLLMTSTETASGSSGGSPAARGAGAASAASSVAALSGTQHNCTCIGSMPHAEGWRQAPAGSPGGLDAASSTRSARRTSGPAAMLTKSSGALAGGTARQARLAVRVLGCCCAAPHSHRTPQHLGCLAAGLGPPPCVSRYCSALDSSRKLASALSGSARSWNTACCRCRSPRNAEAAAMASRLCSDGREWLRARRGQPQRRLSGHCCPAVRARRSVAGCCGRRVQGVCSRRTMKHGGLRCSAGGLSSNTARAAQQGTFWATRRGCQQQH